MLSCVHSHFQCWFTHSLHRYSITEWSMEQKWIAVLLPLLVLHDSKCERCHSDEKLIINQILSTQSCSYSDHHYLVSWKSFSRQLFTLLSCSSGLVFSMGSDKQTDPLQDFIPSNYSSLVSFGFRSPTLQAGVE